MTKNGLIGALTFFLIGMLAILGFMLDLVKDTQGRLSDVEARLKPLAEEKLQLQTLNESLRKKLDVQLAVNRDLTNQVASLKEEVKQSGWWYPNESTTYGYEMPVPAESAAEQTDEPER